MAGSMLMPISSNTAYVSYFYVDQSFKMVQEQFAMNAVYVLRSDESVVGLTAGGSWLTNELDEYSDLDLILITRDKISGDKEKMVGYAKQLGNLLNGFTGEHVGEPRVLICLYDNPLLHVDIKFLTLEELHQRVESPAILLDTENQVKAVIEQSQSIFPYPDYQWIEDRFWIWIHYALLKIGRGEYLEAFDFFAFLRSAVLGPLLHIKHGNLPKGVRKVESQLPAEDLRRLTATLPVYSKDGLLEALRNCVSLYQDLKKDLFTEEIILRIETENRVLKYFDTIQNQ